MLEPILFLSLILKSIQCIFVCQLSVKGYNDKQHILLKKIIEKMATFEVDEKRFDIIKEAVRDTQTLFKILLRKQMIQLLVHIYTYRILCRFPQ